MCFWFTASTADRGSVAPEPVEYDEPGREYDDPGREYDDPGREPSEYSPSECFPAPPRERERDPGREGGVRGVPARMLSASAPPVT